MFYHAKILWTASNIRHLYWSVPHIKFKPDMHQYFVVALRLYFRLLTDLNEVCNFLWMRCEKLWMLSMVYLLTVIYIETSPIHEILIFDLVVLGKILSCNNLPSIKEGNIFRYLLDDLIFHKRNPYWSLVFHCHSSPFNKRRQQLDMLMNSWKLFNYEFLSFSMVWMPNIHPLLTMFLNN